MIKLHLQFDTKIKPITPTAVGKIIKAINRQLGKKANGIINVKVTTSKAVQQLNKQYAGKNQTTDVLSFSYHDGLEFGMRAEQEIGDIAISRRHVKDQAKRAKTDEATELAVLILHGILHILGYDHQTPSQLRQLDKLQRQVMKQAGLAYRNFGWANQQ